jgi:hypothetical protein
LIVNENIDNGLPTMQLSFSETGNLSNTEVPRLSKIVHSWGKIEYLAEAPIKIADRLKARDMWLSGGYIEPYPRGHIRFDNPELAATMDEVHGAGLRGWWE